MNSNPTIYLGQQCINYINIVALNVHFQTIFTENIFNKKA